MFSTDELINFTLQGIDFTLSDFKHQTIIKPYPLHYHGKNSLEIHYFLGGEGKFLINDTEIPITKGTFVITGPFAVHGQFPDANNYLEKISLYFMLDFCKNDNESSKLFNKPYYYGVEEKMLANLLLSIENEFKNKDYSYKNMIAEYIKVSLITLIRQLDLADNRLKGADDDKPSLFKIEQIINNEFSTITITNLAERLYMSVRDLQRFLMKNFNKNFNTLKLEAKMFYASNKLIYTDNPISSIAEDLGYSSSEHFSYAFKKFYDTTPLSYRKNKRSNVGKPEYLNLSKNNDNQ